LRARGDGRVRTKAQAAALSQQAPANSRNVYSFEANASAEMSSTNARSMYRWAAHAQQHGDQNRSATAQSDRAVAAM
jgi:hypothetical protein